MRHLEEFDPRVPYRSLVVWWLLTLFRNSRTSFLQVNCKLEQSVLLTGVKEDYHKYYFNLQTRLILKMPNKRPTIWNGRPHVWYANRRSKQAAALYNRRSRFTTGGRVLQQAAACFEQAAAHLARMFAHQTGSTCQVSGTISHGSQTPSDYLPFSLHLAWLELSMKDLTHNN